MLESHDHSGSPPAPAGHPRVAPDRQSDRGAPHHGNATPHAYARFKQPWWLDAAAPGAWDAVEIRRDRNVIGRLPYLRKRRMGLTNLTQLPLTPDLGPWISEGAGKYRARLAHEHEVLRALVAALPAHDIFTQTCHPALTNCLALHWCGFTQPICYTYRIEDLSDLDRIWAELATRVRTKVRKAERQVTVRSCDDIELFIRLNRMTFARQGLAPPYPDELVRRLDAACKARGVRPIFIAEGQDGVPQAAAYLVWDEACAYGLMSGSDPERQPSGGATRLKWEEIKFASRVSPGFDYGGSMLQRIEPGARALGTRQFHYLRLVRGHTLRGRMALAVQALRRRRH